MTDKKNIVLLIFITLLLLPVLTLALEGDLTLSVPVLDSKIVIQTQAMFAGAVSSLVFRGKEHIDSHDHGRLLQSASSYNGYGECYNPTEGGSARDYQRNGTVSVLKAARVEDDSLLTTVDMGFWLYPGDIYLQGCGEQKLLKQAVNTVPVSGHLLDKRLTVGFLGFPNIIEYRVTFHVPENFLSGTFEASTGYMPKEFSHGLYYNPEHGTEIDPGNRQGEQEYPVVFATPDNRYAMAVYSPQLPKNNLGYGLFSFPDVNKWNCVFRENNITIGPYSYQCLIILGTLNEVEHTLRELNKYYGHSGQSH